MAASYSSGQETRSFQRLQTIQFYMEKHRVEHKRIITKRNRCQTIEATKLCIRNIVKKSKHDKLYYLGSTYYEEEEHLWFYMKIVTTKGEGSLLNIYVIHKKVEELCICLTFRDTVTRNFKSALPGENYYIETIKLTENDLNVVKDNPLFIPISIAVNYPDEETRLARIAEVAEALRHRREELERTQRPITGSCTRKYDTGESSTQ